MIVVIIMFIYFFVCEVFGVRFGGSVWKSVRGKKIYYVMFSKICKLVIKFERIIK